MEIFLISLILVLIVVVLALLLRPKKIRMPDIEDYAAELRLKLDSIKARLGKAGSGASNRK